MKAEGKFWLWFFGVLLVVPIVAAQFCSPPTEDRDSAEPAASHHSE
jgi:hypothetical protein